jgi:hypothetical protein
MSAPLNLFPARVAFTNPDGTLTPDALKSLAVLLQRVGGTSGTSVTLINQPEQQTTVISGRVFSKETPQKDLRGSSNVTVEQDAQGYTISINFLSDQNILSQRAAKKYSQVFDVRAGVGANVTLDAQGYTVTPDYSCQQNISVIRSIIRQVEQQIPAFNDAQNIIANRVYSK